MTVRKIYLASSWFNEDQLIIMNSVRTIITSLVGRFQIHAPFYDGVVLKKEALQSDRKLAYDKNLEEIRTSDLVVAVIDGHDPGVLFEMGAAAVGKVCKKYLPHDVLYGDATPDLVDAIMESVPILAYSHYETTHLNLMLAESCCGFARGPHELARKLENIDHLIANQEVWRGTIE